MSSHNAQEPMDPGDLERKHRVFLCHSGAQKGFVEQLDKDLRSMDRYPFFDKDRESLPIGDNFPSLIFEAIEQCQVGVVFLSEEFFVRSHWPMFEVVKMVECGRRIMPIFLGISPGDLSNAMKVAQWKSKWKVWAKCNAKIDLPKWESTLRSLRALNGLVYNHAIGAMKFQEEIAKEVCKIVGPFHVWDDSHVQGRSRISKIIQVKILETPTSEKGVRVVGLYGVGGIGKTTACKSLCKDLHLDFDGRVCHIEFGDDSSEIVRVREVLKRLMNMNNEFLKDRNLDECWSWLKDLLQSNKVFLAIDNVSSHWNICDEVQKYLSLEQGRGSVMMVSARALGELRNLGIETSNCLAMPELLNDEARALFLSYAKPKSVVDERIVMECVNRCYFGKGDDNGSKHYHPLALKVLGSQVIGRHPLDWISQLEEEDVFNQLQEDENPVFSVLRRSFDSLRNEHKMMFMDVALFDDGGDWRNSLSTWSSFGIDSESRSIYDKWLTWFTILEWLSIVHQVSMEEVKERLNVLKKRALLEELGDGRGQIGMHDLWQEFAIMEAKRGEEEKLQWVYEECVSSGQWRAKSCMSGGGWMNLRRIFIQESSLESIDFSECLNVTVLRLINVYVENGALDLSHLKSTRSLEIVHPEHDDWEQCFEDNHYDSELSGEEDQQHISVSGKELELIEVSGIDDFSHLESINSFEIVHPEHDDSEQCDEDDYSDSEPSDEDDRYDSKLSDDEDQQNIKVSGIGQLLNLAVLIWLNIGDESMSAVEEVSRLTNLQVLHLKWDSRSKYKSTMSLDLQQLRYLKDVRMEIPGMVSISGFGSRMKGLRILDLFCCHELRRCAGVGDVDGLEVLLLRGCWKLEELLNLQKLKRLRILDLGGCYELKCIPGLGNLVALRELGIHCGWLHGLSDLRNSTRLQKVTIYGWNSDDWKSACRVSGNVPNLAMFESVSELKISGVDHELSNLSKLTALKSLKLWFCNFHRLPHMGSDMMEIIGCERFRGLDGVWGLGTGPDSQVDTSSDWTLPYLKEIDVLECSLLELPDLRHFPQLRRLCLGGWNSFNSRNAVYCHAIHVTLETLYISRSPIRQLPDLRNFPSLRSFKIVGCHNLTNLAISEPLSALSSFLLDSCRNLLTVPNTDLFPRLLEFSFGLCGVELDGHEVQKLIARGFGGGGHRNNGVFRRERYSDVVPPSASELNRHADEQAAVDAPNDLAAGPSRSEPCTSEFIPYSEFLSEFGNVSVPKPALELGSSSGNDVEQTNNMWSCCGCLLL